MLEVWDKQKLAKLNQIDIDDWFDVLNNGLIEDRGFSFDNPDINVIKTIIKSDYQSYLVNLVNDTNFHSYYIYRNNYDKIISVCRIVMVNSNYYLEGLETHRDFQKNGFATKLVNGMIQLLVRDDITVLYSKVRHHNEPSNQFHTNFGFDGINSDEDNIIYKLDIENYLRKKLFDDWSSSYNESVKKSDRENTYPFAGYSKIQQYIFDRCKDIVNANILEMGIGTGLMTSKLYGLEHKITGVDLSEKMIKKARDLMPLNKYILSDFNSVESKLENNGYDIIIFSYSIHHMKPINQVYILDMLRDKLSERGLIIIGDVMTNTSKEMRQLSNQFFDIWDDEEYYPTFESYLNPVLKQHYEITFNQISFCSGVMELKKK